MNPSYSYGGQPSQNQKNLLSHSSMALKRLQKSRLALSEMTMARHSQPFSSPPVGRTVGGGSIHPNTSSNADISTLLRKSSSRIQSAARRGINQTVEVIQKKQNSFLSHSDNSDNYGFGLKNKNTFLSEYNLSAIQPYPAKSSFNLSRPSSGGSSNTFPHVALKDLNSLSLPTPDKLELARLNYTVVPDIQDHVSLKFLDLQGNLISRIDNLYTLRNLIFLDLYNNQIDRIQVQGLSDLMNLKALLLGRNKIEKIEGLSNLVKLDILDLHSNRISTLDNLRSLNNLRVLNVQDNHISEIPTLHGLYQLIELNARRNKIWAIHDNHHCKFLSRLILTDNPIQNIKDISSIFNLPSLMDLHLDTTRLSLSPLFKPTILGKCSMIKCLNGKRILQEAKRNALKVVRREETRMQQKEMREGYMVEKGNYLREIEVNWNNDKQNSGWTETEESETIDQLEATKKVNAVDQTKKLHTVFVELNDTNLHIFGHGLAALNRQESRVATSINFDYIVFQNITGYINVMATFEHLARIRIGTTGMSRLKEIVCLSGLKRLKYLEIDPSNPITKISYYRPFTVFMNKSLLELDNSQITAAEKTSAAKIYEKTIFDSLEPTSFNFLNKTPDESESTQRANLTAFLTKAAHCSINRVLVRIAVSERLDAEIEKTVST